MRMCFALAKRGKGKVAPNPLVGCVVLDKHGNIVSKGYHKKYGKNHAERDAGAHVHQRRTNAHGHGRGTRGTVFASSD